MVCAVHRNAAGVTDDDLDGWGWLAWETADSDTARSARLAGRTPQPSLVEIAVRDPDSTNGRSASNRPVDPVTTAAWSALTGLLLGGVAGVWWWGLQAVTLTLAVCTAAGATAIAALWRSWASARRPPLLHSSDTNTAIRGTKWAAYQAITEYTDHVAPIGDKRNPALARAERVVTSTGVHQIKTRAFDLIAAL